jgi:type I restriction enzyme S subunit
MAEYHGKPKSWIELNLNDGVEKISTNKKKIKQKDYIESGSLAIIDQGSQYIGGYTNDFSKKMACELPVIVFGDHTKIIKFVDFEFAPGADGVKIIKPMACYEPKLFAFFLNVLVNKIPDKGYARHFQHLEKTKIPLPSLPEQQRIVEKIEELFSELDNGIESLKKAREQLKTYRQTVLKHAFEGKLTREWREQRIQAGNPPVSAEKLLARVKKERKTQYQKQLDAWQNAYEEAKRDDSKKTAKPKTPKDLPPLTESELAELPELPVGWVWEKLANVTNRIQIGPFGSQLHKSDYTKNGIPIINPKHIKDQKIYPHENISKYKANSLPQYKLSKNDIILGRRGEMGRSAPISEKQNGWFCGTGSLFIRLNDNFLCELYSLIFSERRIVNHLENKSRGTTMTNLNSTILNNLPIQVIPYAEQQKINQEIQTRLSVCDKLEQTIEDSLKKAETLRQSILKKAFEGELTKAWREENPELISGENSVESLVARIRAEKARLADEGKKRRSRKAGKK